MLMTWLCIVLTLLFLAVYAGVLPFASFRQMMKRWHAQKLVIGFMIILNVAALIILLCYSAIRPLLSSLPH